MFFGVFLLLKLIIWCFKLKKLDFSIFLMIKMNLD